MRIRSLLVIALFGLLAPQASTQENISKRTSADAFLAAHGDGWRVIREPVSGNPAFLYGSSFSAGFVPKTNFEYEAASRKVVDENPEFFGFDSRGLVLDQVKYLSLSRIGSSDKVAVLFRQELEGLPVLNGGVSILFDRASGQVLALDTTGVPVSAELSVFPVSSLQQAVTAAGPAFLAAIGVPFVQVDDYSMAIVGPSAFFGLKSPLTDLGPRLAYVLDLSAPGMLSKEDVPAVGRVIVSAAGDLSVLTAYPTARAIDGNVKGNVNTGDEPNTSSNQEQPNLSGMYVRQNSTSGSILTTTDANGNYNAGSGTNTLFFELRGPWVNVNNFGGADASFTITGATGSGNDVLFNPTMAQFTSAEVAGFYWVNTFHDWIVGVDPSDTTLNSALPTRVNRNDLTCNAYYTGGTINLQRAAGSCANTAYGDVILHEEGHWAIEMYNGGATGAFHEGNADAFTYYITDDWCLRHFVGSGCLRSALQTSIKKCPTDGDESCHGGASHTEGQALASALWAVRDHLNGSLGNAAGDAVANALFSGWMNTYNDSGILNVIQDHWLALDDDNGDMSDLTPHFAEITAGFADYDWPAFPDVVISAVSVPITNAEVGHLEPVTVSANIQSLLGGTITGATVSYATNGSGFTTIPMSGTGNPDEFSAVIPGVASPNSIRWFITGMSSLGSSSSLPRGGGDNPELYHAGVLVVYASFDFDAGTHEGWTHASLGGGSSGDQWERANPSGSNESSDPGNAFSGLKIWGTDLSTSGFDGKYEPNTSGELRSPAFDLASAAQVRLQYRRWLAVEEGIFDDAVLYINNTVAFRNPDNGHLLDSEWILHDLDISALAAFNSSVQIKYRLTADGGLEFGGWNIDDFLLYRVDPAPAGFFAQYGTGFPGTGGAVPALSGTGTPNPGNAVTIDIAGGQTSALGFFMLGTSPASITLPSGVVILVDNLIASSLIGLDGSGNLSIPSTLGAGSSGDYYMQAFLADVGAPNGKYSATNGLRMFIP